MHVTLCMYQCVVSTTPLFSVTRQSLLVQCLVASVLGTIKGCRVVLVAVSEEEAGPPPSYRL